MWLTL